MKITIVINSFIRQPSGGAKIIYKYANHFAEQGHQVTIVFGIKNPVSKYDGKIPYSIRHIAQWCIVKKGPPWFKLNRTIKSIYTTHLDESTIPDGDVVFATAIRTAKPVASLSEKKGKKFYLIQDFENWGILDEKVYQTYQLGMTNIVIADWLGEIVAKNCNSKPVLIRNAIDTQRFRMVIPNEQRKAHSIAMIYQTNPVKGFAYGYEVLLMLKKKYPDMECKMFGLKNRDPSWPEWIEYTANASEEQLVEIYNSVSVFLCSSVEEGFGLCGAESMACGCAFVSTDYRGVHSYASGNENALLSPVKDVDALYENVCRVFEDRDLRTRLSKNGNTSIQSLAWDRAFHQMDEVVNETTKGTAE